MNPKETIGDVEAVKKVNSYAAFCTPVPEVFTASSFQEQPFQ
jgi:hypothetical protein